MNSKRTLLIIAAILLAGLLLFGVFRRGGEDETKPVNSPKVTQEAQETASQKPESEVVKDKDAPVDNGRRGEINKILKEAESLMQDGDYEKALALYQSILKIDKEAVAAYSGMSRAYLELGRYDESLVNANRFLRDNPESPEGLSNRGAVYKMMGRYEDAVKEYEKALKNDPEYHHAWSGLGLVALDTQEHKKARELFTKAIEIEPDGSYYIGRAGALRELYKYDRAIADLKESLTQGEKNNAAVYVKLAEVYYQDLGKFKLAHKALNKALELDPEFDKNPAYRNKKVIRASLFRSVGIIYADELMWEKAHYYLDKAMALDTKTPEGAEAWIEKGYAYLMAEERGKAKPWAKKWLATNPTIECSGDYENYARAYLILEQYDKCLECMDKSIEMEPDNPILPMAKAHHLLVMGREQEALDIMRNHKGPLHPSDVEYVQRLLEEADKQEKARKEKEKKK